ncbi:hypothetical protein GGS24DRAFT_510339 [Hypoxylon argillaceum]|nr:hypothetical protein GGS24DRAFT_510339 [Hypoxylon argillaceum]
MLSLSSLLNPAPPGSSDSNRFPPSPEPSSPAESCAEDPTFPDRSTMPKHKMPKDAAIFTKSKPKGAINFQPYEDLDQLSLQRVRNFQVYPLGRIQEYSRHIPYISGKKDFFEKTGRESFEVFQYVFRVPGDDAEYAVMWDYNIGLVRMTPFFKCCKYPKTTPAKMLNSNPGLKEITHSITGGSIMAQGYWMPYQCAKAVCATFCHNISGALIPIFGPDFPALCAQVDAPEYSRMVIDPAIVIRSTREAEYYRRLHGNTPSLGSLSGGGNGNIGPKRDRRVFRSSYDDSSRHHPRYRIRKTYITTPGSENSPYTTDTDGEISPVTDRSSLARDLPQQPTRFLHSPIPSVITSLRQGHTSSGSNSGWTPANVPRPLPQLRSHTEYQTSGPSPWLSAIPRFTTPAHLQTPPLYSSSNEPKLPRSQPYPSSHPFSQPQSHPHPPQTYHHPSTAQRQLPSPSDPLPHLCQQKLPEPPRAKRLAGEIEDDTPLEQQPERVALRQSHILPPSARTVAEMSGETSSAHPREDDKASGAGTAGADKRAALLLMNLSARDRSFWTSVRKSRDVAGAGAESGGFYQPVDNRYYGSGCNPRYQDSSTTSASTIPAKIGSDGVTSETTSLFGGSNSVFPRIKRVRSNSM